MSVVIGRMLYDMGRRSRMGGRLTGWNEVRSERHKVLFVDTQDFWFHIFSILRQHQATVPMSIAGPRERTLVLVIIFLLGARADINDVTGTLVILTGVLQMVIVRCSCNVFPGVTDWAYSVACNTLYVEVLRSWPVVGLNETIHFMTANGILAGEYCPVFSVTGEALGGSRYYSLHLWIRMITVGLNQGRDDWQWQTRPVNQRHKCHPPNHAASPSTEHRAKEQRTLSAQRGNQSTAQISKKVLVLYFYLYAQQRSPL